MMIDDNGETYVTQEESDAIDFAMANPDVVDKYIKQQLASHSTTAAKHRHPTRQALQAP